MKIKAAKIAITTPIIAGLIFSSPWIPLIPDAIEFDCTAFPMNPKANTIAIAKNPAKILANAPVFFIPFDM